MVVRANARLSIAVNVISEQNGSRVNTLELVLPLAYRDNIEIEFLASGFPHDIVHYATNSLHIGEKTIIDEALRAMAKHFNYKERFHVKIHKNVPTGYGLGSGASNAWQVMCAVAKLLKLNTTPQELLQIAQSIKHDIAYFYTNKPALFNTHLQETTPLTFYIKPHILLIMPHRIISKDVIVNMFKENPQYHANLNRLNNTAINSLNDLDAFLANDFHVAAMQMPEIKAIYTPLHERQNITYGVAGRGTIVYVLSQSRASLKKIRDFYRKQNYNTIITTIN